MDIPGPSSPLPPAEPQPRKRPRRRRPHLSPVVPNQVFIGAPWRTVRPKYERCIDKLRSKFPLSFVIIGRGAGQEAEDLLEVIKSTIEASSFAVFDATGGNPNVSLEFGFAEAKDIPRSLYLSSHAASKKSSDAPIIADLAGKRRSHYAQEKALLSHLESLSRSHDYTKRFERFLKDTFSKSTRGEKRRARTLALKIVHAMDGAKQLRRVDLIQSLLADQSAYDRAEIDSMVRKLHTAGLIRSLQGPHSKVSVT